MTQRICLTGLLAAAVSISACNALDEPPSARRPAWAGERLVVQAQPVPDLKPVAATLTSRDMAEARARISGILVSLAVKEGDIVRKGQLIGRVTDDRISLQTGAFDAQVSAAMAQAARAQTELARTRTLVSRGVYAQARLDEAEAEAKAAAAAVAAARAQRAASAELSAQGAILAPASGRVLLAPTPVGSVVTAGQSVARITAGPLVVRIELPAGQARALKPGDVVPLRFDGDDAARSQGVVSEIYPAVTGGLVVADVTAPDLPQAMIGQRVQALVKVAERQALVVPRTYIATRFGIDYAAIIRKDGSISETPVQITAGPIPGAAEVLSGLRVGDILAPAGQRK